MSNGISEQAMRALVAEHGECELAHDWSGALATMGPEPFYEFFPFRLRITGPTAIRVMWDRLFLTVGPIRCFDLQYIDLDAHRMTECVGENTFVELRSSAFRDEEDRLRQTNIVIVFTFEADRIRSETLYADANVVRCLEPVFDAGFRSLPGVQEF